MNAKDQLTIVSFVSSQDPECQLLSAIFSRANGYHCLGVYADVSGALEQIPQAKPDLFLMDAQLPGVSAIEAIRRLKAQASSKILLLFAPANVRLDVVWEAIRAGADGMLNLPPNSVDYLATAKKVLENGCVLASAMVEQVFSAPPPIVRSASARGDFTETQAKILELTSQGLSDKEIADRLGISDQTVSWHFKKLLAKFKVHNRCALLTLWLTRSRPMEPPMNTNPHE